MQKCRPIDAALTCGRRGAAGIFAALCVHLAVLRKFGTFLCLTIVFSWIFANFGFMSILATIGSAKEKEKPNSEAQ